MDHRSVQGRADGETNNPQMTYQSQEWTDNFIMERENRGHPLNPGIELHITKSGVTQPDVIPYEVHSTNREGFLAKNV